MIGSAVPLLFEADAAKDMNLLRGTFADAVIAQSQRNTGCLEGGHPTSAVVHLVGAHTVDGHCLLRAHLIIQVQDADGSQRVARQFWDLQLGAQVTVGQTSSRIVVRPSPRALSCASTARQTSATSWRFPWW